MTRKRNPSGSYSLIFEFLGGVQFDPSNALKVYSNLSYPSQVITVDSS
jgi:hypothetical protein